MSTGSEYRIEYIAGLVEKIADYLGGWEKISSYKAVASTKSEVAEPAEPTSVDQWKTMFECEQALRRQSDVGLIKQSQEIAQLKRALDDTRYALAETRKKLDNSQSSVATWADTAKMNQLKIDALEKQLSRFDPKHEFCAMCGCTREKAIHEPGYSCQFKPSGRYAPF